MRARELATLHRQTTRLLERDLERACLSEITFEPEMVMHHQDHRNIDLVKRAITDDGLMSIFYCAQQRAEGKACDAAKDLLTNLPTMTKDVKLRAIAEGWSRFRKAVLTGTAPPDLSVFLGYVKKYSQAKLSKLEALTVRLAVEMYRSYKGLWTKAVHKKLEPWDSTSSRGEIMQNRDAEITKAKAQVAEIIAAHPDLANEKAEIEPMIPPYRAVLDELVEVVELREEIRRYVARSMVWELWEELIANDPSFAEYRQPITFMDSETVRQWYGEFEFAGEALKDLDTKLAAAAKRKNVTAYIMETVYEDLVNETMKAYVTARVRKVVSTYILVTFAAEDAIASASEFLEGKVMSTKLPALAKAAQE